MKSYTDTKQSEKLAKILPLESADMWWADGIVIARSSVEEPDDIKSVLPIWSLAALLEQIPEKLFDNDGFSYDLEITKQNGLYYINYLDNYGRYYHVGAGCEDTLVDACVDMIIRLHE